MAVLSIKIRAGQGHGPASAVAFGRDDLVDPSPPGLEFQCTRRHVQAPDAEGHLIDLPQGLLPARFESLDPMTQGQRVVGSKTFDVMDLEAGALHP